MKRQILTLGAICAAAFTLTNCNKEIAEPKAPETEGIPFEIVAATADTKTKNDGLNTVWAAGDALNVFHAKAGDTDYGYNDQFTYTGADNKFKGKLTTGLEADSYDWYALYPYNKNINTPAGSKDGDGWAHIGHKGGATQNGYNSTAHLAETLCPLYGVVKSVDASTPVSFNMKHIASVVKIVVTNESESPLTVNSITFTAPEDIVGSYYMNFTDPNNVVCTATKPSYVSSTATLNVTGGTALTKGGKAEFYIPIKPFKAAANKLKITVNGYEKTPVSTANVEFKAGKIETVNFKYNKPATSGTTVSKNIGDLPGLPANAKKLASVKLDEVITVTADGTVHNGKYYTNDKTWRFYHDGNGGFTINAASGHTLKEATITFTTKDNGTLKHSSTTINSGKIVSLSGNSASFTVGSTSGSKGKVLVTAISVTYE